MQLKNLTKLNAARNRIKYLSGKIGECARLQMINLDCNLLEMMPSEISQLSQCLQILKLSQNRLRQLTLSMREMHSLQILNLTQNKLTELPDGLSELQNL